MKPLKEKNIITKELSQGIFSNIETIYNLHNGMFMPELESTVQAWTDQTLLAPTITKIIPGFKFYNQYCSNYDHSISLLQETKKNNPTFNKFLVDAQKSDLFHGTYVTSLLILPIQRIPRYEMFLKELLKLTNRDHPDYNQLQEAFHAVTEMAGSINDVCIKVGYMQKITDIAKATGMGDLLTPTRKFIKQDDIELHVENFDGPAKCYLFNDLVILAGEKKGRVLPTMTFRFANYFSWGVSVEQSNQVLLFTPEKDFVISFSTPEAKNAWHEEYQAAIHSLPASKLQKRSNFTLNQDNSGYHLICLDESAQKKKKKGSGIGFLENWKKEFRAKRASKKRRGTTPEEPPLSDPAVRRKSLPHDSSDGNPDQAPRLHHPCSQNSCHSDSAMQNRTEIRRAQSTSNKARITKSSSSMHLNMVSRNDIP